MSARLIILVVVLGALAVGVAFRKPAAPAAQGDEEDITFLGAEQSPSELAESQQMLKDRPLPGEEPEIPPELNVRVEVDTSRGKNRLYLYITEAHGYYVETFDVRIWFVDKPGVEWQDAPMSILHHAEKYLKANDTLTDCLEVVPAEMGRIGGHLHTSDKWQARVERYSRAREKNPEKFHKLSPENRCN